MSHNTIPRPPHANEHGEVSLIPLLPLQAPPEPLDAYTITTHLIPAAFPRSSPFIPVPAFPNHESRDERGARIRQYTSELLSLQAQHVPNDTRVRPTVLWSVLNRYVRTSSGGGLTLLLLHPNGLHKETFEPTLHHLLQAADEDKQYQIDEVWALDAVQHGDSGLVNAQDLGALFIWSDHARDILNFILHFLPEIVTPSALPTHLAKVPIEVSKARERRGFTNRKLIVVGHSFSGCAAVLAAHSSPAPFSGLVLVDPVIMPPSLDRDEVLRQLIVGALARRSIWPSREEAYSLLSKSPFFGAWDPGVLKNYVNYALVEDSSGQVSLKCTNVQEAVVFADGIRSKEAWSALPQVDNRIAIKWLVPSCEESVLQSYELVQEAVWRRPENATNTVVSKAAHLVTQDSPRQVAQGLHDFLLANGGSPKSHL
ncbi:Alpha/beta hydrolase family-domain-containing protein [Russula compacta]|nr:Alpha/beta hydrolase family-domain-containing protein [Russula compacta]